MWEFWLVECSSGHVHLLYTIFLIVFFIASYTLFKFIPEIPGKNISYPGKNKTKQNKTNKQTPGPGPNRNKIPLPDPKILLKMFPDPDRFRSGPEKLGVLGCPAGL